jgi:hypothetical protein
MTWGEQALIPERRRRGQKIAQGKRDAVRAALGCVSKESPNPARAAQAQARACHKRAMSHPFPFRLRPLLLGRIEEEKERDMGLFLHQSQDDFFPHALVKRCS